MELRHIGIVVDDLAKMREFYSELLDIIKIDEALESGDFIDSILGRKKVLLHTVKMTTKGGSVLELLHYENRGAHTHARKSLDDFGLTHIAVTVEDVEALHSVFSARGIQFISSPAISDTGLAKVCFCRDPEGNYLELVQNIVASSKNNDTLKQE